MADSDAESAGGQHDGGVLDEQDLEPQGLGPGGGAPGDMIGGVQAAAAAAAAAPAAAQARGQAQVDALSLEGMIMWRIFKTLKSMLTGRGYSVESAPSWSRATTPALFKEYGFVDDDGKVQYDELSGSYFSEIDPGNPNPDKIGIFFPSDLKVGVDPIRNVLQSLAEANVKRGIVVVRHSISPFAKQAIVASKGAADLQTFLNKELMFDLMTHEMVPKTEPLSVAEKAEMLRRYKIKLEQLPRIRTTDPVARYYGLSRGQVVRITRDSDTAGTYITYRVVMNP